MNKVFCVIAALIMNAVCFSVAFAADPSGFSSLQPFRTFGNGEGHGVAYRYVDRSKADFVRLLRDAKLAKKEMRLTCQQLVRQMADAHKLPYEGCEGAAAAIEKDDDYQVVACTNDMFKRDNWLVVTNSSGTAFGAWPRECLPGEQVLTYKSKPIVSLKCLNVAIPIAIQSPVVRSVPVSPAPVMTANCPNGVHLNVNFWEAEAIKAKAPDLMKRIEEMIVATSRVDSEGASNPEAYKGNRVSRTYHDELVERVRVRASVNDVTVSAQLLDEKMNVVEDLGSFEVKDGIARIPLTEVQIGKIIQKIYPAWVSSPVVSADARRLLFFPSEWMSPRKDGTKPRGEHWCTKHESAIYWKNDRPVSPATM